MYVKRAIYNIQCCSSQQFNTKTLAETDRRKGGRDKMAMNSLISQEKGNKILIGSSTKIPAPYTKL